MSIIADNSYRYNYEMQLWCLADYTAEDLLENWQTIYDYAAMEESAEDVYFLADCLDVLNEKVLKLPDSDRIAVLDKAKRDIEAASIGEEVMKLAG